MQNRQTLLLIGLALLFAALAAAIGVIAYNMGQKANQPAEFAAAETSTPVAAPKIVTNTPTATATPAPTTTLTFTPSPTATPSPTPTPTPIVVITHVKELGRLETTEFAMRTVIDLANDRDNLWEKIFGSDQLLLVAEGEVVAGFDLDKLAEEDIRVDGLSVVITLPAPEILYSRVDNERTQVYERNTGLFLKPDPSLESRARQLAEESMTSWAIERGIIDKAATAGQARIENLLLSLGFTDIVINVKVKEL